MRWQSSDNISLISLLYKDLSFEEIKKLQIFTIAKTLLNIKSPKHLENSYKLTILEFISVRSFLSLKLVYHSLSSIV